MSENLSTLQVAKIFIYYVVLKSFTYFIYLLYIYPINILKQWIALFIGCLIT